MAEDQGERDRISGVEKHAERLLAAAQTHPECLGGEVAFIEQKQAAVELQINVDMPLHMRADGISQSGVRRTEPVTAIIDDNYPWSPPVFFLRNSFPRDLPHLQPGSTATRPRPCLIDGNEREFFIQFGLLELAVFHFVHQLVLWLRHAAEGTLINPKQGWEPTLRRELFSDVVMDSEACRNTATNTRGFGILKATYLRLGDTANPIGTDAYALLNVESHEVALNRNHDALFTHKVDRDNDVIGNTLCCVAWPEKLPTGDCRVSSTYVPETVTNYKELLVRAGELGCGRSLREFMSGIERWFQGRFIRGQCAIPIAIVLCAHRPVHLMGTESNIELLPYVLDIRPSERRTSLLAGGRHEPVLPAVHRDSLSPALLRRVSGAPDIPLVAMLGCGSVGSKTAMHLARSGAQIAKLVDKGMLLPHHMARHALARPPIARSKAMELAGELRLIGQTAEVLESDLIPVLLDRGLRENILANQVGLAVNTTASLAVREALSSADLRTAKPRLVEAALFGRGLGGFLLLDGADHNPTLSDLTAELYATADSSRLRELLFDPEYGLTEVQIGQGCSSLTMPMTDMRLSAMTATLTEQLLKELRAPADNGKIVVSITADDGPETKWFYYSVPPFTEIKLEGTDWTLRLSRRVLDNIYSEIARWQDVEAGGLMIGTSSARLRTVTVVDLLPAPPDSCRSASRFVMGTQGLKAAINSRHKMSGSTLFDVGTWHSHLTNHGPSKLDRNTAAELSYERPPPSALLIVTPDDLYGLMHSTQ